jgi:hypothetical protein
MSAKDAQGAALLYGAPQGGDNPPPPPPPPPSGTPQTGSTTGQVAQGQSVQYQPIAVLAGTVFTVTMTGSGDADLYVRFGAAPNQQEFDCRPYLTGSNESCSVDVPDGQSQAFMMVEGYATASYTLKASWTAP